LTWVRSRTLTYQFERLRRGPYVHRADQDVATGDLAESVVVTIIPDEGLPRVPDLLPEVRGGGR